MIRDEKTPFVTIRSFPNILNAASEDEYDVCDTNMTFKGLTMQKDERNFFPQQNRLCDANMSDEELMLRRELGIMEK